MQPGTSSACYMRPESPLVLRALRAELHSLDYSEARQSSRVRPADEDPWCLARFDRVSIRLGELHGLCKVLEVVNRLLNGVVLEAGDRQVVEGVRKSVVTVLEDNRGTVLGLRDLPVDGAVREVPGVCCTRAPLHVSITTSRLPKKDVRAAFASPGVKRTMGPPGPW